MVLTSLPQPTSTSTRTYNFQSTLLTICNKEYSYFCSKQKEINQWHICACILNLRYIYLWTTYLSAIIQLSCWLGNILYVKNFAIDHFLSKKTWVLTARQSFYYPKITKILCLPRCVACEVRVNLNYSKEVHITLFYWFKIHTWHCKSNRACATATEKSEKQ